jgi:hypothetical protein
MMQARFLRKGPGTDPGRSAAQKVIQLAILLQGVVLETIIAFATLGKGIVRGVNAHGKELERLVEEVMGAKKVEKPEK